MAADEWFRQRSWSAEQAAAFFSRLARSKTTANKAQYLRIQALTLAEARDAQLDRIALALLRRLFDEWPDPSQLAGAHLQAAHCWERLGNLPTAVAEFRLSLQVLSSLPSIDPGTALAFPWFVVTHQLVELYPEALRILDTAHLTFPIQHFQAEAVRSIVAESVHHRAAAAQHARAALSAAEAKESQFRYHRSLGLVTEEYEPVMARLRSIAATVSDS